MPADIYFGRGETILLERERIQQNSINERRLQYRKYAAYYPQTDEPNFCLN